MLSRAFKLEVDEPFIETVVKLEPMLRLLSESQEGEELKDAVKLLLDTINELNGLESKEKKKALTNLAAEFARVFLGVGPDPVYPIESVHLGKDHLLYEEPFHEIMEAYRRLGFEKEKSFQEPEDHVSVEFEFMATLCRWTSRTLETNDIKNALAYLNLQKEFLDDHLMKWVPQLCRKLEDVTVSNFYKSVARLTVGFIALDSEIPDHLTQILKNELKE